MSKKSKDLNLQDLYRDYQETRDTVPESLLTTLRNAALSEANEGAIHEIVQRSKVADQNTAFDKASERQSEATRTRRSFTDSLTAWLSPARFGGALAALVLAVVLVPMFNSNQQASQYAFLSDCADCVNYVQSAARTTRSGLGVSPALAIDDRLNARLGRVVAQLLIAKEVDGENIDALARAELKKLAELFKQDKLSKWAELPTANEIIAAISDSYALLPREFKNARDLFLSNVVARQALESSLGADQKLFIDRVTQDFIGQTSDSVLDGVIKEDLKVLASKDNEWSKLDLQNFIDLTQRAMATIGL